MWTEEIFLCLLEKSFKASVIVLRGVVVSERCMGSPNIHCMKGFVLFPVFKFLLPPTPGTG